MPAASSPAARRSVAVESFMTAGQAIGPLSPGVSVFAITRGQFSMIDAVEYCLDQAGPAEVSLWTWTVADYEIQSLKRLQNGGKITSGLLVVDGGARTKNKEIINSWQGNFGPDSVRYCRNHAKIATIKNSKYKLLLRGSMNLNFNPRFEQFDLTEGGPDFDLVKQVESELPLLPNTCTGAQVYAASRVSEAFSSEQLDMFSGCKMWAK